MTLKSSSFMSWNETSQFVKSLKLHLNASWLFRKSSINGPVWEAESEKVKLSETEFEAGRRTFSPQRVPVQQWAAQLSCSRSYDTPFTSWCCSSACRPTALFSHLIIRLQFIFIINLFIIRSVSRVVNADFKTSVESSVYGTKFWEFASFIYRQHRDVCYLF